MDADALLLSKVKRSPRSLVHRFVNTVTYDFELCDERSRVVGLRFRLVQQLGEIPSSELPVRRFRHRLVVLLEARQPLLQRRQRGEIIGRESLASQDRKVNFNLIEPAGMHRPMHQQQTGMLLLPAGNRSSAQSTNSSACKGCPCQTL